MSFGVVEMPLESALKCKEQHVVSIVAEEVKGVPVVHLSGEFRTTDTESFLRYVFDLADQLPANQMVIDLAGLRQACSGIFRVLVLVQRKLAVLDGRLVVAGVTGTVREILNLTQVDSLLDLSPCTQSAVTRLGPAARLKT